MSISRSKSSPFPLGILPNNFFLVLVMMRLNNCPEEEHKVRASRNKGILSQLEVSGWSRAVPPKVSLILGSGPLTHPLSEPSWIPTTVCSRRKFSGWIVNGLVTNSLSHCYGKRDWSVQSAGLWENGVWDLMDSRHSPHSTFPSQNSILFSDLAILSAWFSDKREEMLKVSCAYLARQKEILFTLFKNLFSK